MEKTVFTNGCFDLLHPGHVDLLGRAAALGNRLIVGINSDASVRKIKGPTRPLVSEQDRRAVLLGLKAVDDVRIFDEPTPQRIIEEIKPNVLIKGGDWPVAEIVGADFVLARGGEVYSLPLKNGFSTTAIVERILQTTTEQMKDSQEENKTNSANLIENALKAHQILFESLLAREIPAIEQAGELICRALASGKKVLLCGNGGSAADAQHIAAEFVGRYERERRGLPSIALTTDTSALTAIGNDYGYERIFARQIEALANEGDVLIGISTSGNSPNILAAMMTARSLGCITIGLTGAKGIKLASISDAAILVPSERTARIQEAHGFIGHVWCEMVDARIAGQII
jgi:D-sedoheptulose 7-phosphate isomerase